MNTQLTRLLASLTSAAFLLTACGGGGDGTPVGTPAAAAPTPLPVVPSAAPAPITAAPAPQPSPTAPTPAPAPGTAAAPAPGVPAPIPAAAADPAVALATPDPATPNPVPAPAPELAQTFGFNGTVATGAPLAGATVTVYDSSGSVVGTALVANDGSYVVTLPATARPPLVLEASREDIVLVSAFGSIPSRLNITPLTNLIAARLAPDGNPLSLKSNPGSVTSARVLSQVNQVLALIQPVLTAVGDNVNPLTGVFLGTGTGHDKVLDSLSISIRPSGTSSNIEIALRTATPNQPIRISFVSTDPSPAPLPGTVQAADLPVDGTAQMISDLASRMTRCYALPVNQRVNSTAVTAAPINIVAAECRTLFVSDDPASFRNNGAMVGAQGAFSGIFRDGATGVVFNQAQLQFFRGNAEGDLVFSYRTVDRLGNVGRDTLVARIVNGALKLIGNQYIYSASVRPYIQDREFVNQPSSNYFSVGYSVNIINEQLNGSPIFAKVVVTTPPGSTLTYKPNGGRSSLSITKPDGSLFSTDVIRLAARFADPSVSGTPSQFDTGLFFASPAFTEDQIRSFPEQGLWRLEFFHADASKPNVVQSYRTIARASTLAETMITPFAQLSASAKSELKASSAANGFVLIATPTVATLGTANDFWTVSSGAFAPTSVTVFGSGPAGTTSGSPFDDGVNVASTARKVTINCSRQTNSDNHCDTTNPSLYAQNTSINSIQLFAVDSRLIGMSKLISMYYLRPR